MREAGEKRGFKDVRRDEPPRKPFGEREEKPRPTPFPNGKCNPLCPYFKCLNNALTILRKPSHGRMHRVAYCRWIGDECIGGSCQYASCALKALLPDGSCLYAKERMSQKEEESIESMERELMREEEKMSKVRKLMKRRGYIADEEF